jgi:hypothetical protein
MDTLIAISTINKLSPQIIITQWQVEIFGLV